MEGERRTLLKFLQSHVGFTINVLLSWALFWGLAFPAALEYGYSDDERTDQFAIGSGPKGSGVVPILSLLLIIATVQFLYYMYGYFKGGSRVDA